jgi:DeoR/GlpR family transcriptional regulator of sugar metabolism
VGPRKQRLTQQERHAQLLALLRREGTVRIATLAKVFDVTTETARRDLDELARRRTQATLAAGRVVRSTSRASASKAACWQPRALIGRAGQDRGAGRR